MHTWFCNNAQLHVFVEIVIDCAASSGSNSAERLKFRFCSSCWVGPECMKGLPWRTSPFTLVWGTSFLSLRLWIWLLSRSISQLSGLLVPNTGCGSFTNARRNRWMVWRQNRTTESLDTNVKFVPHLNVSLNVLRIVLLTYEAALTSRHLSNAVLYLGKRMGTTILSLQLNVF